MKTPQTTLNLSKYLSGNVGLRFGLAWLLTAALCAQAVLPPIALANNPKPVRSTGATFPEARPVPSPAAKKHAAQTNAINVVTVSAASFETTVTPDSIMSAFGTSLATRTEAASSVPLPTTLAGTTVRVRDSNDVERLAPLFFVSVGQINYLIPTDTASGTAIVTIVSENGVISQGVIQVNTVGPGIFTANASGQGVPAAAILRVHNGEQSYEPLSQLDPQTGRFEPRPIDPGPAGDQLFLLLFLTGLRRTPDPNNDNNANENVRVLIGGTEVPPLFAGKQGGFEGLDQVNVEIPRNLFGRGRLGLGITVNGFNSSNVAEIDLGASAGDVPPQISDFGATTATAGQSLTINGSGFSPNITDNLVRIGTREATVVSGSQTQLSLLVPYGAQTGRVTVRTPQGEAVSTDNLSIRTSVSGIVETTSRSPLAGVTVRVAGTTLTTTTNAAGLFFIPDVSAGAIVLEVDGTTVPIAADYPRVRLRMNIAAGRDNILARPIALQFIQGATVSVSSSGLVAAERIELKLKREATDTNSFSAETNSILLDVPSGTSVNFNDVASDTLTLTQIEGSRTPFALPNGIFSSAVVQIAPYGASFSQGGKLTFPNSDNYPANAQAKLYRLNQTPNSTILANFVEVGAATVSADGKTIETQEGVVTESGCYFVAAPRSLLTLVGRVTESTGTPVRGAFINARGQGVLTDGNGAFVLRLVPASQGEKPVIDVSYLRSTGRIERLTRTDFTLPTNVAAEGYVRVTPDFVLGAANANRPPVILAPTSISVAGGQSIDAEVVVSDQDAGQTVQLGVTGATFATLANLGNNFYRLRIAPGVTDIGSRTLSLVATDSAGATATQAIALSVTAPPPRVNDFSPKSGIPGTTVTLTGISLKSAFGNPTVTFTGPSGRRQQAFIASATATEVRVTVPNGAVTGVLDLSNTLGRTVTTVPFTVDPSQSFTVNLQPSTATALQGGTATFVVSLTSTAANFSQLAQLSVAGLPQGVTAKFSPEQITAGATSTLSLMLPGNLAANSYNVTVSASALVDGVSLTRNAAASLTVQPVTQTTLSGRVLSTKNIPLSGVTVSLDGKSATTDAAGAFLLSGIAAGQGRPVMVNGATVTGTNLRYPAVAEPIDIVANQANVVPYTFYLPPIDTVNEVTVVPNQQTIVTTPDAPGFRQTIPANAGLRNRDGSPVTRTSVTCVDMDRTPAPLPASVGTNVVFTSQPGGARPAQGTTIPVTYPNLAGLDPGSRVELYNFDPDFVRWYIYGYGRVSADGKLIVPEPGVGLPYFSWHFPNASPNGNPSPDDCPTSKTANTVDLATGLKIEKTTDIAIGGARGGLELTRIHTSDLPANCDGCPFGRGTTHNYDVRLTGTFQSGGAGRLVMPDQVTGRLFSYARTGSDGALVFTTTETTRQLADVIRKLTNGTYEYRMGDGMVYRFNASGRLTAIVDRNANTTTLSYTGDNLTRVTDAVGRALTLAYDGSSRIISVTDPLQRVWRYSYEGTPDVAGSPGLTTVTDPLGNVMRYSYVTGGRLASVTDERGNVTKKLTYDDNGRVVRQEFADGGFETYSYKLSGNVVSEATVTDALNRTMTKRFNTAGYVIGIVDELGQSSEIKRDLTTNVSLEVVGPCGCSESKKTFDSRGLVLTATDRINQKTELGYAANFTFITSIKDALGRITRMVYDARGNRTTLTDALGRTTTFAYDSFGQLLSLTDPLNHTTRFGYDANGFVNRVTDALSNITSFEYDAIGRLRKITDGEGRATNIAYDNDDRITTITDPAGIVTRYEYDPADNRTAIINAQSKRWAFTYDSKNRLSRSTDPLNQATQYRYDTDDELTALLSPSGRVMRYEYDARGQRTKLVDPLKGEIRFNYDNQRNLSALTDQRGNTTTFTYDELYRLSAQRDPLGRTTTFGYDAVNNLVETVDRLNRRTTIKRDALNRPETITYVDAAVGYGFDEAGRLTRLTDTQSGALTWGYDDANRLLSETTPQGVVRYSYNKASQRATMTAADRPVVTYGYDDAGRISTIKQGVETFTWAYDDLSRMKSLSRPNNVTTSYEYDAANKLSRILHANAASVALEDFKYGYNIDDEIESIESLGSSTLLPTAKAVNAADAANRIPRFGQAAYSFDEEGQTRTKTDNQGTTTYDWDARGRLAKVTLPNGQTASYGYDALGRRTGRTAAGLTTNFLYDGQDIVLDRGTGGLLVDYLNGPGIDNKLRQTSSNFGALYFLRDHLGSTSALTHGTGGVLERAQYEAFGASANASLTRYGFTGRESDAAAGLIYYRARWYDAQQGRFLSEDPFGFDGGSINLHTYVNNNPLSFTDPTGEFVFLIPIVAGAAIGLLTDIAIQTAIEGKPIECIDWDSALFSAAVGGALNGAAAAIRVLRALNAAKIAATGAKSATDGLRLSKYLASQAQMGEVGEIIAGTGGRVPFRDAGKIARQYGGKAADWVKKRSSSYTAKDGTQFETHWVENIKTGERVEFKTKFPR